MTEVLDKETVVGTCEVCGEPIVWTPGHRLTYWKEIWDYEDGYERIVLKHWRCLKKKGD
jgi:hypothetical protein